MASDAPVDKAKAGAARSGLRSFFFTGLAALLPTILTLGVLAFAFGLLNDFVGKPIGRSVLWLGERSGGRHFDSLIRDLLGSNLEMLRADYARAEGGEITTYGVLITVLGFPVAVFIVVLVGFLLATFLGKGMARTMDSVLGRFPIVRVVYPYAKQFTEFFFSPGKKVEFKTVVAVPYPRPGMFALGFVTSEGLKSLDERAGARYVSVFIPTSPTPFTGFVIFAQRDQIVPLPITIDEAVRFCVSAGVLIPEHQIVTVQAGAELAPRRVPRPAGDDTGFLIRSGRRPPPGGEEPGAREGGDS